MILPQRPLPPEPPPPGLGLCLRAVGLRLWMVTCLTLLCAPLWPIYLGLVAVYGRPPHVAPVRVHLRWLRAALRRHPALPLRVQALVALGLLCAVVSAPLPGLAWLLDELLEGAALDRVRIVAPIFELSAARSGSTQLAHIIEQDPRVVAPSLARMLVPYRWAWRLCRWPLVARHVLPRAEAAFLRLMPAEYIARHELDLRHTDTFEVWFFGHRGGGLVPYLGEATLTEEFGAHASTPASAALWEEDLVAYLERLGQKLLLDLGPAAGPRHLMVKGHFLASAPALAARFPDARFVTVLRAPLPRLQSCLNFMRLQPGDPGLPPRPWAWVRHFGLRSQVPYNELERRWFTAPAGPVRVALPFRRFVDDLPGALLLVFGAIFGDVELAPHLPRAHGPRERERYAINHSLEELGVDAAAVEAASAAFTQWMRALEDQGSPRPIVAQPLAASRPPEPHPSA